MRLAAASSPAYVSRRSAPVPGWSRYTSASRSGTASTTDSNRSARLYSTAPPDPGSPDEERRIRGFAGHQSKGESNCEGTAPTNLTDCQKTLEVPRRLLQPVLVLTEGRWPMGGTE